MEPSEYRRLYELEHDLWWFQGMERISMMLLNRHAGKDGSMRLLDAGCGTGGMMRALSRLGRVTGVDRSSYAVTLAKERDRGPVIQADVARLPFSDASFDAVTSLDVLYHLDVEDDVQALRELARVMRADGTCVIRVPANDKLRSQHDEAVHTRQRYGKKELTDKLRAAGLDPIFVSFANCFLYPVARVRRRLELILHTQREGSEVEAVSPLLNTLLALPLRLESVLLRFLSLPFGLSLVAVARKLA